MRVIHVVIYSRLLFIPVCARLQFIYFIQFNPVPVSLSIKSTHLYKRTKKKSTIERTIVKLHNPSREVLFIHMYVKRKDSYVCMRYFGATKKRLIITGCNEKSLAYASLFVCECNARTRTIHVRTLYLCAFLLKYIFIFTIKSFYKIKLQILLINSYLFLIYLLFGHTHQFHIS